MAVVGHRLDRLADGADARHDVDPPLVHGHDRNAGEFVAGANEVQLPDDEHCADVRRQRLGDLHRLVDVRPVGDRLAGGPHTTTDSEPSRTRIDQADRYRQQTSAPTAPRSACPRLPQ